MARVSRASKSGPGYVGLIFFIVLSLALIGGYVWLVPEYAKLRSSLAGLQRDIKENIDDKVKGLGVAPKPTASPYEVAYDSSYFRKLSEAANDGINYKQKIEPLVGYPGGEQDTAALISAELTKGTPAYRNLREEIEQLLRRVSEMQIARDNANRELENVRQLLASAQRLQNEADARAKQAQEKALTDLERARKDFNAEVEKFSQAAKRSEANTQIARAEQKAELDKHKAELTALQTRIARLETDNKGLKEDLERKRPKPIPITEGKVLQADLIEGKAIISLGQQEGIGNGEKFTVMGFGKGGQYVAKGELQAIRVDALTTTADIIKQDLKDPIMRNDVVQRQKKTEDAAQ